MYAKAKGPQMPSDVQAKERLAVYVYEYLMHVGAKQAAQTFLNEIRYDKQQLPFNLNEPPGFLLSWWCVFWDLYSAAPDRRSELQTDCSNEAKAFHEYGFINPGGGGYNGPNGIPNNAAHSPLTQIPPQDTMAPNNNNPNMQPNNFFSPNSQPPPTPQQQQQVNNMMMQNQGYSRYPGPPRPPMRVPSNDYNGPNNVPGSQMGIVDPSRVPPGMNQMNRLTPPGVRMPNSSQSALSQMANYNSSSQQQSQSNQGPPSNMGMRGQPPPQSQMGPNSSLSPMPMNMQQNQVRWPGPQQSGGPTQMNYSSPSPVPYGAACAPNQGPGTPIMQSPQDSSGDLNYQMMKNLPGGMNYHDPNNMSHMVPMNSHIDHNHLNGELMDSLKNSPISNIQNSRHTGDEHSNTGPITDIGAFTHFGDGPVQNESDVNQILKLKESIQEETIKRFEKQSHHDMYPESS